jgi:thiol-disulfide isomerase/thioredoxin
MSKYLPSIDTNWMLARIKADPQTTAMYIVGIIAFLIAAVWCWQKYVAPSLNPSFKPNREAETGNSGGGGKHAELMLFYTDWCPHCKTAKPIWEELQSEYQDKTINGYNVIFTDINCTTETAEIEQLMNKYKIEGYPTIKLLKDGQIIEYDAKPNKETLVQFLNSVL